MITCRLQGQSNIFFFSLRIQIEKSAIYVGLGEKCECEFDPQCLLDIQKNKRHYLKLSLVGRYPRDWSWRGQQPLQPVRQDLGEAKATAYLILIWENVLCQVRARQMGGGEQAKTVYWGGSFLMIGGEVIDLKAAPRDSDAPGEEANRV